MTISKALARFAALGSACLMIPAAVVVTALLTVPAAAAENSINVAADHAKVISITGEPAAVIIGNPTFADVTVRQGVIIIHGRQYGSTNLVILDDKGEQLANFELHVGRSTTQSIAVYKAGRRQSYSCAPNCEATLSVGDTPDFFEKAVLGQITAKMATAVEAAKLAQ